MTGARAAALAILLAAGPALAEAPPRYQLAADASWQPAGTADDALVRMRRPASGQLLVVTDLPHPNPERAQRRYRDQVVAGLAGVPGYRQLERHDGEPSSSWTIDLVFERLVDGVAEVVAMRFYLVYDHTLILTVITPADAWPKARAATRKLLRSFKPAPR